MEFDYVIVGGGSAGSTLANRLSARSANKVLVCEAGEDTPYPGWDVLKEEEREEASALFLEIRDASGTIVNRIAGNAAAGMHRTAWDLRYAGFSATGGPGPRGAQRH